MSELRARMSSRIGDSSGYINGGAELEDILEPEQVSIYQCCRNGDVSTLERLLSDRRRQIHINDQDDNGLTALHYAARDKHFEVAKLLIEKGKAYAAAKDEDGATPLHYCARKRQKQSSQQTVDLIHLLAYLTDVNVRDKYLCTPLHFAAIRGNDVAAQALLDCKGIDVNAADSLGCTPLHEAAIYNDVQVAMLLIQYGADLQTVDNTGRTALHFAVMGEDNVKMIKVLLQNTPADRVAQLINKKDKDSNTALHLAIDARNTPAVKILLNKGSHVNEPCRISSSGSSPLHLAAITGDTQITDLLLAKGARMYGLDLSGSTPLHKAVEYQNRAAVELLISQMRSSPNQKDGESYTPLLVAVCYSDVGIVRALLDVGSDVTAVDRQERNALHLAAANDEKDTMKVLIQYVVDNNCTVLFNEEDRHAETPLHIASRMGHLEIAQLLIESGVDLTLKNEDEETAFLLAAKTGNVKMVELFIQTSEKVLNDQDEFSNSALHLAASGGHLEVVQTLVRNGADKEMRNVRLDTPMDHACSSGRVSVVGFLLEEEVSPNDEDDEKDTPLLLAAGNGHEDVVGVLIEKGADVKACDKMGRNCLSLAIDKGNRDVAKAIIQSSRWRQALLQDLNHHDKVRDTPLRKLIRSMPDVAQLVLTRLITASPEDEVHPSDPSFWYHFDFTFIDDTYFDYNPTTMKNMIGVDEKEYDRLRLFDSGPSYSSNKLYLLENHPIMVMVDKKRDTLLSHPLVVALIRHKWNACRPAYFGYMLFYAIFLIIMSAYMVVHKAPYGADGQCNSSGNGSVQGSFEQGSTYFIIVFAVLGIISEIAQMFTQLHLYMVQPMNLLDWFTYISSILVTVNLTSCGARTAWQWQLGAFCMFATWINFLLLLRRLPVIGIYAVMIQDILKTFSKFLGVFVLFLIAFSLTFFTLFRDQDAFKDPGQTIVKTWSMMLGEFNYDELFYSDTPVPYLTVSYTFFVVFLIVMAIVVVNLMTGLAIDDVNELQSHARLRKLAIQMELAIAMEVAMPKKLRRAINYTVAGLTMYPNEYENSLSLFFGKMVDGSILNKRKIVDAVRELEGEEQSEITLLEQKLDRFIHTRKTDMQKLNSRLDKLEDMIVGLAALQSSGRRRKKAAQLPSLESVI